MLWISLLWDTTMIRVLVVDDEEDIRGISTRILESAGHEVDTAEDGALPLR